MTLNLKQYTKTDKIKQQVNITTIKKNLLIKPIRW